MTARWAQPATAVAIRERVALLSHAEETALARAWRDHGDVEARNRLIRAHMAFAFSKTKGRFRTPEEQDDLHHEAVLGLFDAVDRFNPDLGWRFSTYASWWVMASLKGHAFRNNTIVQVGSASYRKILFSLRKTLAKISAEMRREMGREPPRALLHAEAARQLGVEPAQLEQFLPLIISGDLSLNTPLPTADGDEGEEIIDRFEDRRARTDLEFEERDNQQAMSRAVADCLKGLSERERLIIERRHLAEEDAATLQELSDIIGVTRDRVRQIEVKALEKISRSLRASGARPGHFGFGQTAQRPQAETRSGRSTKKTRKG